MSRDIQYTSIVKFFIEVSSRITGDFLIIDWFAVMR